MYAYARATQLPEACMGNACAGRRRMVDAQRARKHFSVFLDFKLRLSMFFTTLRQWWKKGETCEKHGRRKNVQSLQKTQIAKPSPTENNRFNTAKKH